MTAAAGAMVDLLVWAATEAPLEVERADVSGGVPWVAVVPIAISVRSAILAGFAVRNGAKSAAESERSRVLAQLSFEAAEDQRRSENTLRDRSQASLVWAWVRYEGYVRSDAPEEPFDMKRFLEIMNASSEPVFDVVVLDPEVGKRRPIGLLLPTAEPRRISSRPQEVDLDLVHKQTPIEISFRDSSGRLWVRDTFEDVRLIEDREGRVTPSS